MTEQQNPSAIQASVRPGERQLDQPRAALDAGLVFIGHLETPWTSRGEAPKNPIQSDAICTANVLEPYRPALAALATCSHVILLYWLDQARRDMLVQAPRHAPEPVGTFALRSPNRFNPIGLAVCDLLNVDGENGRLSVRHLDALNGTPLLDIKPYFASIDARPKATVGWANR
ncbi:MAG: tRNA (N6-threonylcarbamoyladenosine(37)-N6)-methyltransferase TrmO [Pseudomonadota bacterium]